MLLETGQAAMKEILQGLICVMDITLMEGVEDGRLYPLVGNLVMYLRK